MTNTTKWFIAVPFAFFVAFVIPPLITQDWVWFTNDWGEIIYVILTAGMWLIATSFVDVKKPREAPDLANRLIPFGLILSVPVSVADRLWGLVKFIPDGLVLLAVGIGLFTIVLGISARKALGQAYSPRGAAQEQTHLIRQGPYRWVRHPLYLAAILWCIGWPLFLKSLFGSLTALAFIIPALLIRINSEEQELIRVLGEDYRKYKDDTWRLLPFIY
ncbi:MAG: isoprenylcysteine carboxylmethyltransferase family protein [Chloroflexi bacterium]|nr:isoprenylcysteine carboxylmethyltransferase family protein [Chloroflexota bacterium]